MTDGYSEFEAFSRELAEHLAAPVAVRLRTARVTRIELCVPRQLAPVALGPLPSLRSVVTPGINPNRQRVGKSGELPRRR